MRFVSTRDKVRPGVGIEREVLEGMLCARTSLFEVQAIQAERLLIRDLLEGDGAQAPPCTSIVESSFSRTAKLGVFVFIRLIQLAGFGVTTGLIFPFNATAKKKLLDAYDGLRSLDRRREVDPIEKFVLFFKLHHELGIPVIYNDV